MFSSLLLAAFLIFANGFFVAAEFALVKVRATQLEVRAAAGNRSAAAARSILDHLDAYLSATQLGITLASLALGWIGEPTVAHLLEPVFARLEVSEELAHTISMAIGFTVISFLHIVVGEVAPKSLALAKPEAISMAVAVPMRAFYFLFLPALVVLNKSSNALLRAIGVDPGSEHGGAVRADELRQIAENSADAGQITQGESALLSNVFTFSDRVAREIMVPRSKVRGIDLRRPLDESLRFALENGHSRYPLYDRDLEGVVGVLHAKDLTARMMSGPPVKNLRELARPAIFVPETMSAQRLLRIFQRQRAHLAIVLDEFGGVTGVVTIEDTLEELVGEIQDEHDEERMPVEEIAGGFSVEGRLLLSELERLLEIPPIDTEAATLSGYIMENLGRVALLGDSVEIAEWVARVVQIDRRSIERVEITRPPESKEA